MRTLQNIFLQQSGFDFEPLKEERCLPSWEMWLFEPQIILLFIEPLGGREHVVLLSTSLCERSNLHPHAELLIH